MSLILYNGHAQPINRHAKSTAHMFAAAESRADLIRMLTTLYGVRRNMTDYIRKYWSEGCWGRVMEGITPERGVWVQDSVSEAPYRVFPAVQRVGKRVVRTLKQ